jgi:hypothetical protein
MVAKRKPAESKSAAQARSKPSASARVRRLKSQAWFWTPEWQAKEHEADEDIAAGRMEVFYSDEEFLAALTRIHEECLRTHGQSDSGETSSP